LTDDERRWFRQIIQRVAALVALGPSLNELYEQAAASCERSSSAAECTDGFLDPGSVYKSTSARLAHASMQQRLVARAADIGKHRPELPVARKRAVLTALIERIEMRVDQIDIRLRPPRLSALLDAAATPLQGAADDQIEIPSLPVRLRRAGGDRWPEQNNRTGN
jgi:hypothetical protein